MKVILYMAMTVNGIIARENDDTPWSREVWRNYYKLVKQKKNIVIGRRTYDIMKSVNEFKKLNNPFTVVLSNSKNKDNDKTIFVSSPKEALSVMKKRGFREVIVGGGSKLNASFLKENLIDEICLDVEPLIFGKGIRLFSDIDAETKLKLLKLKKISKNTLRLRYKVIK